MTFPLGAALRAGRTAGSALGARYAEIAFTALPTLRDALRENLGLKLSD